MRRKETAQQSASPLSIRHLNGIVQRVASDEVHFRFIGVNLEKTKSDLAQLSGNHESTAAL
jgi:hypothetical protein